MSRFIDARVPVLIAPAERARPDDAVFAPPDFASPDFVSPGGEAAHGPDCSCCGPRGEVAQALGRLFLARARGEVAFFRRVLVSPSDREPVEAALRDDAVCAARYRLVSGGDV